LHYLKTETKTGILSRGESSIRFTSVFPVVVCPPLSLRDFLYNALFERSGNLLTETIYPSLVPYILELRVCKDHIRDTDFCGLFALFITADKSLQVWIEHYYTPEAEFAQFFLDIVVENLASLESLAMPFFQVEALHKLFEAVATMTGKSDTILKSAADLLIQLRMSIPMAVVHQLAFRVLNLLQLGDRLFIFNYLVSDLPFLLSDTKIPFSVDQRPKSLYIPILSLFFRAVTQPFMENEVETLRTTARCLSLLACTLEQYVDPALSYTLALVLFPLLLMLFTFYDSLSVGLGPDIYIIAPILLFCLKYCDLHQFRVYFDMLSFDNQLRFFTFLIAVSTDKIIENISQATSLPILNASHGVCCRILRFVSFMSIYDKRDLLILSKLFLLLTHLLEAPNQACDSFRIIFAVMAYFVTLDVHQIFTEKTDLVINLMSTVVAITKRRFPEARSEAVGFILWLLDLERKIRPAMTRCLLALRYAAFNSVFTTGSCKPFWDHRPREFSTLPVIYNLLIDAIHREGMHQHQLDSCTYLPAHCQSEHRRAGLHVRLRRTVEVVCSDRGSLQNQERSRYPRERLRRIPRP
jgi:hypothetical protein